MACTVAKRFEDPKLLGASQLLAWVLMPDHVHWLLQLGEQDALPALVGKLKSASAREANRLTGETGSLWAPAFHDRAIRSEEEILAAARYVVANPLRAGLVNNVADYAFWNSVWL